MKFDKFKDKNKYQTKLIMKTTSYTDEYRSHSVSILNKALQREIIARNIEKGVFNYVIKICSERQIAKRWENPVFKEMYMGKIRSLYTNLKTDSYVGNREFKTKVLAKEFDWETLVNLQAYEVFPENWKEIFDKRAKRDRLKYELKPEAMTDVFKCHRCGSRSCSYYEVQTRSADEPMTQFINCLDCGNRWKQ